MLPEQQATRYYAFVGSLFVATLLISNIAAQKLIPFGPFVFTGGILLFPVTYIFGDVLTEVYGFARARHIIWAGFFANALMAIFVSVVIALPPAPGWPLQDAFASALGLVPRVVLASLAGYWVGEFANSIILARLKVRTEGRLLWLRTISSTAVGQALDTVIFAIVAFWGVIPQPVLITAIWSGYLFKVVYEAIATPMTYVIVNALKRAERIDVFDRDTAMNPFVIVAPKT